MRLRLLSVTLWLAAAGCAPAVDGGEDGTSSELSQVPQSVVVNGQSYDVENEYLPRVVQCENPKASAESLKAQAIAARTWLTANTGGQASPHVGDSQSAQVFTCSANQRGQYVPPTVKAAVQATRGQIVLHNGVVTGGFYVAGANQDSACHPTSDDPTGTQHWVTERNVNQSGDAVLGRGNVPSTDSNRGCMGQLQANCLAGRQGLSAAQLLAYFYGADIEIRGTGTPPAVPTDNTTGPNDTNTTDPSAAPPSTSSDPQPSMPAPPMACSADRTSSTCWSYTLQCWTPAGVCVQSAADQGWYQCVDMEGWVASSDGQQGVLGPCSVSVPLSTP
jgi:hypothetical protein